MRPKTTLPPATSPRFEPRSVKSPSALLSPTSIRDEAALLLSIAPICESEIREDGISFLWTDEEQAPAFPLLVAHEDAYKKNQNLLAPRNVSMDFLPSDTAASRSRTTAELTPAGKLRARAVSMDHQDNLLPDAVFRPLSPKNFKPARKFTSVQRNHRKSSLALGEPRSPVIHKENLSTLQPDFPREALAKRVYRKKFSWKNYPEVSETERYSMHPPYSFSNYSLTSFYPSSLKRFWSRIEMNISNIRLSTTRYSRRTTTIA